MGNSKLTTQYDDVLNTTTVQSREIAATAQGTANEWIFIRAAVSCRGSSRCVRPETVSLTWRVQTQAQNPNETVIRVLTADGGRFGLAVDDVSAKARANSVGLVTSSWWDAIVLTKVPVAAARRLATSAGAKVRVLGKDYPLEAKHLQHLVSLLREVRALEPDS